MDVEESDNEPRSELDALRDAIQDVIFSRSGLVECCVSVSEELERHGDPHPSEWPGKTPGDEKLLTAKERKTKFVGNRSLSDEDWLAREVGWPQILDKLQRTLDHFWKAIGAAKTAFDQLPPEMAPRIEVIDGPEWPVRFGIAIDSLEDWFRWTGPRTPGEHSDAASIVNRLHTSEPPPCRDELATLRVWEQILWSIDEQARKSRQTKRQFPSEAYVVEKLVDAVQTSKLPIKASKDNPEDGPHQKAMMAFLRPFIGTAYERRVWGYFYKLQTLSPADRELVERAAKAEGMAMAEFSSREILQQLRHFLIANEIPFLEPVDTPQSDGGAIEKPVATDTTKTEPGNGIKFYGIQPTTNSVQLKPTSPDNVNETRRDKETSGKAQGRGAVEDSELNRPAKLKSRKEWPSEPPAESSRHRFGPVTGTLKLFADCAGMDARTLYPNNGKSYFYIRKVVGSRFEVWLDSSKVYAEWNATIIRSGS